MARATFEGPILSGDTRFGALRNVGYAGLNQSGNLLLTNVTANTANYGGVSGQFVDSNGIPNTAGVVYVPSSSTFPSVVQAIPADTATNIYRGFVAYLPTNSRIVNMLVDVQALVTVTGTLTSQTVYISNNYTAAAGTPTYAATGAISAVGRQALATFTATQLANMQATSTDILQSGQPNISQVVFTIAIVGTTLSAVTAGQYIFTVQYTQADGNIGTTTAYPYGNFD
tara:strand:+ start:685 stop:1368 length:684 start_codon:yes stop_codon:yes gene_type:complete